MNTDTKEQIIRQRMMNGASRADATYAEAKRTHDAPEAAWQHPVPIHERDYEH